MADMKEIWRRLESWYRDYAPEVAASLKAGATEAQLARLEKRLGRRLPEDFRESYKLHDGQRESARVGLAMGMNLQPLAWSLDWMKRLEDFGKDAPDWLTNVGSLPEDAVQRFRAHRDWVPVTNDSGGNFMGLDMAPGPKGQVGQVIIFGSREETNYVVAPSWTAFLEHVLHLLESGNVYLGEKDDHGGREFDTLNPIASHFHDYVARLYKRDGAAKDRPPLLEELTMGAVPDSRRGFHPEREAQLRRWATGLQLFRLHTAWGEDQGDAFLVSLRCATKQELEETRKSLKADLKELKLARNSARFKSEGGVLSLVLSGAKSDPWVVTEVDYEQAKRVEQVLQRHRERLLSPPRASPKCICPEYYPELWGQTARVPFRKG